MSSSTSDSSSAIARKALCVIFAAACFLAGDRLFFSLAKRVENHFNRQLAALDRREPVPRGFYSTLIFGSSRTFRSIHPKYFWKKLRQKAFKEAEAGKGLKYDYLFYQQFCAWHGKPRLVLLGLDYFMFGISSGQRELMLLDSKFARLDPYAGGISLLLANKPHFDQLIVDLLNHVDTKAKAEKKYEEKRVTSFPKNFVGYPHQPGVLKEKESAGFTRYAYHPFPGKEGVYLLKLLEELHRDGVTAILVMIPDYIGTYESNFEQEKFRRDIERLIRPFPNTHLLNYNDHAVFPLREASYFLDGGYGSINSHLSLEGGRPFNMMLLEDLREYYFAGASGSSAIR